MSLPVGGNDIRLSLDERLWIEERARAQGFDLAGLAPVPEPGSPEALAEDHLFAGWVASGAAADMDWLTRSSPDGSLIRGDLRRSFPWARSVLVCAVNYNVNAPRSIDPAPPGTGWIARYAWSGRQSDAAPGQISGSDYHDELLPRLQAVAQQVTERFGEIVRTRCYVDTGPILERGYAARAGVGWIGRNTCVLHQQQGSFLLLGVIVTSLSLAAELAPSIAQDRCGSCTRCIDACPTDALHGSGLGQNARRMDASRCIAYLTIEKKGSIDTDLREPIGRHVFGCDICQDVCPWNRRAATARSGMLQPRPELVNPALNWLAAMDGPAFNRAFNGSPLERTRRKRILRNVAIAMGNSADKSFRPQLETWTQSDDPVLAETAAWALEHLDASGTQPQGSLAGNPTPEPMPGNR